MSVYRGKRSGKGKRACFSVFKGYGITVCGYCFYRAYAENGAINTVPAFKVQAVDTTGAGDTFNSAFAVARACGKTMSESITFANAAAALSVQKIGAQGGMPYLDEVEGMLSECRK